MFWSSENIKPFRNKYDSLDQRINYEINIMFTFKSL